jgi:hypothetical protein
MAGKPMAGGPATRKPASEKPDDSSALPCCEPDRTPSFNETTIRALEDARAGIGVTEYADAAELFEKMGIKVGKEKKTKA